jgi:hypothetical protein
MGLAADSVYTPTDCGSETPHGWLYLFFPLLGALLVYNAARPSQRPFSLILSWFLAFLTIDLALLHIAVAAVVTGIFAWAGALASLPGKASAPSRPASCSPICSRRDLRMSMETMAAQNHDAQWKCQPGRTRGPGSRTSAALYQIPEHPLATAILMSAYDKPARLGVGSS